MGVCRHELYELARVFGREKPQRGKASSRSRSEEKNEDEEEKEDEEERKVEKR